MLKKVELALSLKKLSLSLINRFYGEKIIKKSNFGTMTSIIGARKSELPSLSSPSEGIWTAAVPAASRIPFEYDGKDGKI